MLTSVFLAVGIIACLSIPLAGIVYSQNSSTVLANVSTYSNASSETPTLTADKITQK